MMLCIFILFFQVCMFVFMYAFIFLFFLSKEMVDLSSRNIYFYGVL